MNNSLLSDKLSCVYKLTSFAFRSPTIDKSHTSLASAIVRGQDCALTIDTTFAFYLVDNSVAVFQ
eukprot:COSAG05_NODE_2277_length_3294_cov_2.266354_2_plen_65_part_00